MFLFECVWITRPAEVNYFWGDSMSFEMVELFQASFISKFLPNGEWWNIWPDEGNQIIYQKNKKYIAEKPRYPKKWEKAEEDCTSPAENKTKWVEIVWTYQKYVYFIHFQPERNRKEKIEKNSIWREINLH